jgi:hypothetical protein
MGKLPLPAPYHTVYPSIKAGNIKIAHRPNRWVLPKPSMERGKKIKETKAM